MISWINNGLYRLSYWFYHLTPWLTEIWQRGEYQRRLLVSFTAKTKNEKMLMEELSNFIADFPRWLIGNEIYSVQHLHHRLGKVITKNSEVLVTANREINTTPININLVTQEKEYILNLTSILPYRTNLKILKTFFNSENFSTGNEIIIKKGDGLDPLISSVFGKEHNVIILMNEIDYMNLSFLEPKVSRLPNFDINKHGFASTGFGLLINSDTTTDIVPIFTSGILEEGSLIVARKGEEIQDTGLVVAMYAPIDVKRVEETAVEISTIMSVVESPDFGKYFTKHKISVVMD